MSHAPHQHRRHDDPNFDGPPAGLTYEQLEFFTEQTERAVQKANDFSAAADRRAWRNRMTGFAILFLAFLGNVLYSNHISAESRDQVIRSGDLVAVDGCNRDFRSTTAVRGVLVASKGFIRQSVRRGALSQEEASVRLAFYDSLLDDLPLPDCRKADDVLTDDPDAQVAIPQPLYADDRLVVPPVSSEGRVPEPSPFFPCADCGSSGKETP